MQPDKQAAKPTVPNQPAATPPRLQPPPGAVGTNRRTPLLVGAATAAVILGGLTLWAVARDGQPRLNEDTVSLVKFVAGKDYAKLPFHRQAEYMKVLEDRDDNDELEAAFEAGNIGESEYRAALMEAWLGQQLKRSDKFATLAPGVRDRYIRDLLDKKDAKDARKAARGKSADDATKVKRDKAMEDIRINAWPPEARARYEQYRRAYAAQKDVREAAAEKKDAASGS